MDSAHDDRMLFEAICDEVLNNPSVDGAFSRLNQYNFSYFISYLFRKKEKYPRQLPRGKATVVLISNFLVSPVRLPSFLQLPNVSSGIFS